MLSQYIPKRYATAMLKHVVAVSLFFPYVYSKSVNFYYADFILANFFAILTMIFILTSWKLDFKRNGILLVGMGILLIAYNVFATYMNYTYHHWYGEQINTTISFLLFMVLLMVKEPHALIDHATIRSIIHMMVLTNVISIFYRLFTGYNSFFIMNNYAKTVTNPEKTLEHYSWLYLHKSQYGLILVLCISFCIIYHKHFKNSFTYIISLCILLFSLYISDAYTSIVSCLFLFIGLFFDYLFKAKWWKKLFAIITLCISSFLTLPKLYKFVSIERDILTIGGRTRIWNGSWEVITNNPNGVIDFIMGQDTFISYTHASGWSVYPHNCHNIFLNHMFRFSIPVGGIFIALTSLIVVISLKRNPSFFIIGFWLSLFIPWCMDYSMTSVEITMLLFVIYLIGFYRKHHES